MPRGAPSGLCGDHWLHVVPVAGVQEQIAVVAAGKGFLRAHGRCSVDAASAAAQTSGACSPPAGGRRRAQGGAARPHASPGAPAQAAVGSAHGGSDHRLRLRSWTAQQQQQHPALTSCRRTCCRWSSASSLDVSASCARSSARSSSACGGPGRQRAQDALRAGRRTRQGAPAWCADPSAPPPSPAGCAPAGAAGPPPAAAGITPAGGRAAPLGRRAHQLLQVVRPLLPVCGLGGAPAVRGAAPGARPGARELGHVPGPVLWDARGHRDPRPAKAGGIRPSAAAQGQGGSQAGTWALGGRRRARRRPGRASPARRRPRARWTWSAGPARDSCELRVWRALCAAPGARRFDIAARRAAKRGRN